ncbi:MAG: carbon storage regulator [Lachnospiraceae bacterium]|nr:carbon storage regulator [Lachnospiraceae bacterium]
MLKLTLKAGEYLLIGDEIKVVYTGGSSNNGHLLVDAPKSVNIARSTALEKYGMAADPGNEVRHHKDRELSPEAKMQIKAILMEERKRAKREKAFAKGNMWG